MGIFFRTRDIIAANMADLLDRSEDPAKMIRMIILDGGDAGRGARIGRPDDRGPEGDARHVAKLEKLQASWTEKAEPALSKGREDLAKAALVEKQKASDMAEQLAAEIGVLDDSSARPRPTSPGCRALREARTKQNGIMTRIESARELERMREMVRRLQGRGGVQPLRGAGAPRRFRRGPRGCAVAGRPGQELEEEIAELRTSEKVDAELEALEGALPQVGRDAGGLIHGGYRRPGRGLRLPVHRPVPLIFHYITQWKKGGALTIEDEAAAGRDASISPAACRTGWTRWSPSSPPTIPASGPGASRLGSRAAPLRAADRAPHPARGHAAGRSRE